MIIENFMDVGFASDFEIVGRFDDLDVIFERNLADVSPVSKIVHRIFEESFDSIKFDESLVKVVSFEDFSDKNGAVFFVSQFKLAHLFQKSFDKFGLTFLGAQSVVNQALPEIFYFHFTDDIQDFLMIFQELFFRLVGNVVKVQMEIDPVKLNTFKGKVVVLNHLED